MSISFKRFIQIAGVKDADEAKTLVDCGVNYLGFPLNLTFHQPDLSETEAAEIIKSLSPPHHGVLITYLDEGDTIVELCEKLGCSIVQIHEKISKYELARVRNYMPNVTIIKSLIVSDDNLNELINEVDNLESSVDAFIIDTYDHASGASGATGKTHDWNVSRTLTDLSSKPVILAGGLNETNVYEAIKFVRCSGVDTHTGVEGVDGWKDEAVVRKFIAEANRAFKEVERGL
jgi:phosphoribosylanthranilate isomerase